MRLVYHGGKCCGVKTIYGMGVNPNSKCLAIPARGWLKTAEDLNRLYREAYDSGKTPFDQAAPQETALARFDRFLAYADWDMSRGAIEVVLAVGGFIDQSDWFPLLEERGFVNYVPPFINSNSGNMIHIYHRITK